MNRRGWGMESGQIWGEGEGRGYPNRGGGKTFVSYTRDEGGGMKKELRKFLGNGKNTKFWGDI